MLVFSQKEIMEALRTITYQPKPIFNEGIVWFLMTWAEPMTELSRSNAQKIMQNWGHPVLPPPSKLVFFFAPLQ